MLIHIPSPNNLELAQRIVDLGHLFIRDIHQHGVLLDPLDGSSTRDGDNLGKASAARESYCP